mmetsp:Transcript_16115/g.23397  ORF Transcript_16115/g.23397 Transcript_16115/m.23397 type:complete len:100 (+) Transcript_16115:549-848(+)
MKRVLRKAKDVSFHSYLMWYTETNKKLNHFLPFQENQVISNKEVVEHLEFAIPNSWHRQMVMHDFHPIDHTTSEITEEFCERLEFTEKLSNSAPKHHKS